ncbi:MAG: hypothetical protein WBD63_02055 [Phycisphaerae bacterium]|nr:hypothetical protein [Phycisphaerae bacterium]
MNGRDTVTIQAAGKPVAVHFLAAAAGLEPFVGAFEVAPEEAGQGRVLRVAMEGLKFLWSADAALDADQAAERIMRSVGLLAVESYLAGHLAPDKSGVLQVRDFIGSRYPDYTSVERFVGSLYESPGRIQRLCREDVLQALAAHAAEKKTEADPTGPGLTVPGILAWPGKRRFYADENVRDALLAHESDDLVHRTDDRYRLVTA